jgi:proline iminopeptidase
VRVRVNGVELFFDVDGARLVPRGGGLDERPTLLLVHGAPGFADHTGMKPALGALRDVAQLVYLDLRGCGRSESGPPASWTLDQWADDLFAFCQALGIERPIVLGESAGGMVVMSYAARHPEHPAAIVLSSTQARLDVPRVLAAFERRGGRAARDAAERFLTVGMEDGLADYARLCMPLYSGRPESSRPRPRAIYRAEVARSFHEPPDGTWLRTDLRDRLSRITCPTLVLGGEEDPVCPIEDQAEIAAGIAAESVRLERFAGCGHGPYDDDPERVLAAVRAFVREVAQ